MSVKLSRLAGSEKSENVQSVRTRSGGTTGGRHRPCLRRGKESSCRFASTRRDVDMQHGRIPLAGVALFSLSAGVTSAAAVLPSGSAKPSVVRNIAFDVARYENVDCQCDLKKQTDFHGLFPMRPVSGEVGSEPCHHVSRSDFLSIISIYDLGFETQLTTETLALTTNCY